MNRHLFLYDIKQNLLLFFIILTILVMYFSIITNMFDPAGNEDLIKLASMKLSPELMRAFGFDMAADSSLTSFLSSYMYGMLMLLLPLIYANITANRLMAQHVDKGDMAFLLSAPLSRTVIAATQAAFLLASTWLLIGVCCTFSLILCHSSFPGLLNDANYIRLNGGLAALMTLLSGIGFLASACCNESKWSLGIGLGLPLLFYVFNMAAEASGSAVFRYLSVFSLFENTALANGEGANWKIILMFGGGLLFYLAGILTFRRRNLSL